MKNLNFEKKSLKNIKKNFKKNQKIELKFLVVKWVLDKINIFIKIFLYHQSMGNLFSILKLFLLLYLLKFRIFTLLFQFHL